MEEKTDIPKPLTLFHCKQCSTIISSSFSLSNLSIPDSDLLPFVQVTNVKLNNQAMLSVDDFDLYCAYQEISCLNCDSFLGKFYLSAPVSYPSFLNNYLLSWKTVQETPSQSTTDKISSKPDLLLTKNIEISKLKARDIFQKKLPRGEEPSTYESNFQRKFLLIYVIGIVLGVLMILKLADKKAELLSDRFESTIQTWTNTDASFTRVERKIKEVGRKLRKAVPLAPTPLRLR